MNQANTKVSDRIDEIELHPVWVYVQQKLKWPTARVEAAVKDYREYLRACLQNRRGGNTPTPDVDEVWHAHILHTKKYAEDCKNALGFFLHHDPFTVRSTGMNCTDCGDGCDCGD